MSDALLDIAVYRGEVETIVEWQQEVHYENVAEEVAEDNFEIGHLGCTSYHTRHRDEGNARESGANHTNGYDPPRR
jgi:hypothetical protein